MKMCIIINYLSFLFFFLLWSSSVFGQQTSTQESIMLNLLQLLRYYDNYDSINYPTTWNASKNPCTWEGVICTNNSVTQLHLSYMELTNSSFLSITCQIESLEVLDVSYNFMSSIPDDFYNICGKLSSLKSVDFSGNTISGNLPSFSKGGFTNLESLDLSYNTVNGCIGTRFDGLANLKTLNLNSNFLGNLKGLEEVVNCKNLKHIDISNNRLVGTIPPYIFNLTNLENLHLQGNSLSGSIPKNIGNLHSLIQLRLQSNSLSGEIPPIPRNTQILDLSYNKLSGNMSTLFTVSQLWFSCNATFRVSYCLLQPFIFNTRNQRDIKCLENLKHLDLSSVNLTALLSGNIPDSLKDMSQLSYLNLAGNRLSGGIPSQPGFKRLSSLDLSYNNLSGPIPPKLQKFKYDAFYKNRYLCGYPMTISCDIVEDGDASSKQRQNDSRNFYIGLYVSMGLGFYFGFWGVCGTLALKHTWRYAFFGFIDSLYNRIYVTIAIYIAKFQRNSQT